jgi:hypothetical protein
MSDIYLTRDERLLLTLLNSGATPIWTLNPWVMKHDPLAAFNNLHKQGLVEYVDGEVKEYRISERGRVVLMGAHGLSFFDLCYRADEDEHSW